MELIIIQDTKYLDLKLYGPNYVFNNISEFLHRLTVEAICRKGFQATILSIETKVYVG
ncbi:MAG: hypothetical protein MUP22_12290 [Desulfobacterales bacterium]|nr:hypothetical protein [Desulfobacterales bacterium]